MDIQTNFSIVNSISEVQDGRLNIINCTDDELKVELAKPTAEAGQAALAALEAALQDYRDGWFDVLVTAPINKHTIQSDTFHFPGHTEYIEERVGEGQKALMILLKGDFRVALVTGHIPVREVAETITQELIMEKIAVQCFGPYPADGFMGSGNYRHFDGILAMYHDQGLAPFKALAMDEGVNYTAGLPIVRTSPAHGTAYDIAGQGIASEDSFRQAIYVAIDIFRNRMFEEEISARPLRKQYYEKRDDSDKLKLDSVDEE